MAGGLLAEHDSGAGVGGVQICHAATLALEGQGMRAKNSMIEVHGHRCLGRLAEDEGGITRQLNLGDVDGIARSKSGVAGQNQAIVT